MKVLIEVGGASVSGSEQQARIIAAGLRARGHDVVVACRPGGAVQRMMEAAQVRTAGARLGGDADVWNGGRFAAWVRAERPDAVLLTSWKRLFAGAAAARAGGAPRVLFRLGGPQKIPARGISAWKYRRAFRWLDGVVVNSQGLREVFMATNPTFPPRRVRVVHNAARAVRAAHPAALREEIGAAPGDVVLLGVGGLYRHKRFDLLAEALARLERRDVHLAVAGSGPLAEPLRAFAASLGVGGRFHLLGPRKDVPALLAAADAFVLASRRDSMANAMLEAMAAGLPVVATDVPGSHEALAPHEGRPAAGWIVPRGDVERMAETLAEVVDGVRSGAVRARAAEAEWRARHWFTPERMAAGYDAALAATPPRR